MDSNHLNELDAAVHRPETIAETEAEVLARDRARQLYRQSSFNGPTWIDDYEAGWKATKAYGGVQ